MKNIELLRKQYFIHPDKTDEEVIKEVAEIDAYVKHKIITDIDYVPKNIEEARQHPLWVEGHLPILHRFNIVILVVAFCILLVSISLDPQPYATIIGSLPITASIVSLVTLDNSKKGKRSFGNNNPISHYAANLSFSFIIALAVLMYFNYSSEYPLSSSDTTRLFMTTVLPYCIINIIVALLVIVERKRYFVNYPPSP